MRGKLGAAVVIILGLLSASCGASRPVKYYSLEPQLASGVPAANQYAISLVVGHISAPPLFRDDRIVYTMGPVQRGAYEYHRWAEPPTEMISAMLVQALRSTGQYRSVERLSSSVKSDYIVKGRVFAIEESDSPSLAARFAMEIELYQPKSGTTVWTGSYTHDEAVSKKSVDAVIEAMDRNVKEGLSQLVAGVGQYFASHPPQ